jgi:hypothetical protein
MKMGMTKSVEIRTEDVEPVAPPVQAVETATAMQSPQGSGV